MQNIKNEFIKLINDKQISRKKSQVKFLKTLFEFFLEEPERYMESRFIFGKTKIEQKKIGIKKIEQKAYVYWSRIVDITIPDYYFINKNKNITFTIKRKMLGKYINNKIYGYRLCILINKMDYIGYKKIYYNLNKNINIVKTKFNEKDIYRLLFIIKKKYSKIGLFHPPFELDLEAQYIEAKITSKPSDAFKIIPTDGRDRDETELEKWDDILKNNERIIVLGNPGAGKTTLLQMTALECAYNSLENLKVNDRGVDNIQIPLFISCALLVKNGVDFLTSLKLSLGQDYDFDHEKLNAIVDNFIKRGKVILLVDGMDEVSDSKLKDLSKSLNNFLRFNNCRIVCASRFVGYYRGFVQRTKEFGILPFSRKESERYIRIWFDNQKDFLSPSAPEAISMINDLRNKPQLNSVAQNPLLLSLLCSLYSFGSMPLPARPIDVYEDAVRYMLVEWRRERDPVDNSLKISQERWLLECLAYLLSSKNQIFFDEVDLLKLLNEIIELDSSPYDLKDHNILFDLLSRCIKHVGLISKVNEHPIRFAFIHRSFQEYLTAYYLKRTYGEDIKETYTNELASNLKDDEWHDTIAYFCGLLDEPQDLLYKIYTKYKKNKSDAIMLICRCLIECNPLKSKFVDNIIDEFLRLWYEDPMSLHSLGVGVALGGIYVGVSESITDFTEKYLEAHTYSNFLELISNLHQYGHGTTTIIFLNSLYDNIEYYKDRLNVSLKYFENIIDDRFIDIVNKEFFSYSFRLKQLILNFLELVAIKEGLPIITSSINDSNKYIRASAVAALNGLTEHGIIELLINALDDEEDIVRTKTINILIKYKNSRVHRILKDLISSDPISNVRKAAIRALEVYESEKDIAIFIKALDDSHWKVRKAALLAIREYDNDQVFRAIEDKFNDPSKNVKETLCHILVGKNNGSFIPALISATNDQYQRVRRNALYALCKYEDERIIDTALDKTDDIHRNVREAAVILLSKWECEEVIKAFFKRLTDEDEKIRMFASEYFGDIALSDAVTPLTELLRTEKSKNVIDVVSKSLIKICSEENCTAKLGQLFKKSSVILKSRLIHVFEKINNRQSKKILRLALNERSPQIKILAIKAIERNRDYQSEREIVKLIGNVKSDVSRHAIIASNSMKFKSACRPLIAVLKGNKLTLKKYAACAVGNICCKDTEDVLIESLDASCEFLRKEAIIALGKIRSKKSVKVLSEFFYKYCNTIIKKQIGDTYFQIYDPLMLNCDPRIGLDIIESLGKIDGEDGNQCLIDALKINEYGYKSAAKAILKRKKVIVNIICGV